MTYQHQSVRDYVAAKQKGDTRTTDGSEAAELGRATMEVPLGQPRRR